MVKVISKVGTGSVITAIIMSLAMVILPACTGLEQARIAAQETAANLDGLFADVSEVGKKLDELEKERKAAVAAGDDTLIAAIVNEGKQVYELYLNKREAVTQATLAYKAAATRVIEAESSGGQWWQILGIAVGSIGSIFGLGAAGTAIQAKAGERSATKEVDLTTNALRRTAANAKRFLGTGGDAGQWDKFKSAQSDTLTKDERDVVDSARSTR